MRELLRTPSWIYTAADYINGNELLGAWSEDALRERWKTLRKSGQMKFVKPVTEP